MMRIQWRPQLHFHSSVIFQRNRWQVLCLVPILPSVLCSYGSYGDMEVLFACKEGFRIRVNNTRHVAVLLDVLLERSYIQAHWKSVLERGRFLVSKDGKRFVTTSSLSTALSAARIRPTSVVYAIRTMIGQLL